MEKFHHFNSQTFVTLGQVKGMCMLPLPPSDTGSEKTNSKEKAVILENAIISWSKQIRNVLKLDPETALKSGNHPDPLVEIDFWKSKSQNLDSIVK